MRACCRYLAETGGGRGGGGAVGDVGPVPGGGGGAQRQAVRRPSTGVRQKTGG